MTNTNRDTINRQISIKARDILTDNQDTIIAAISEGLNFATLERLDLERAFDEGMQNETYTLSDATNIINAHGVLAQMRETYASINPSDGLKEQAADTFKILTRRQIEFLYGEMVEAFDERKEDMEPANAALSAFEVCTKPKKAHDPIHQCMHCSANLFKVGIIEVCIGGTAETKISFVKDSTESEETQILHMDGSYIRCAKCNKKIDGTFEDLLDIYLNNHSP